MSHGSEEYVTFLIALASEARVAQALRRLRRTAFVLPAQAGCVVVRDEGAASGAPPMVDRIAQLYSLAFNAPILAAGCDSQAFFFRLAEGNSITAAYNSTAIQWHTGSDGEQGITAVIAACRAAARLICAALGKAAAIPYAQDVLLQPERFISPMKQHAALVEVLGMPTWSVGAGFGSLSDGVLPVGPAAGRGQPG